MFSSHDAGDFVRRRVNLAGEEVFSGFEGRVAELEERVAEGRKMLERLLRPEVRLVRIDALSLKIIKEEVVGSEQQRQQLLTQPKIEPELEPISAPSLPSLKKEHHLGKTCNSHTENDGNGSLSLEVRCRDKNPSESKLPIHKETGVSKKSCFCKECGKAFKLRKKLWLHMRTHTGEKPYVCPTCGKRMADPSAFKRHLKLHTDEKPFSCEICGRGFKHSNARLCHVRSHTGERPYLCSLCGNRFVNASKLRRHSKTHTGERPHVCDLCGRGFIRLSGLRNHKKRVYRCQTRQETKRHTSSDIIRSTPPAK